MSNKMSNVEEMRLALQASMGGLNDVLSKMSKAALELIPNAMDKNLSGIYNTMRMAPESSADISRTPRR